MPQETVVGGAKFGLVGGENFEVVFSEAFEEGPNVADAGSEVGVCIGDGDVVEVGGNAC